MRDFLYVFSGVFCFVFFSWMGNWGSSKSLGAGRGEYFVVLGQKKKGGGCCVREKEWRC